MKIEEKLYRNRFCVDQEHAHITVNKDICKTCTDKPCLYCCPVENYQLTEDGELQFSWVGCVECGCCRIACDKGAVTWDYPRGGFGVCFRYG